MDLIFDLSQIRAAIAFAAFRMVHSTCLAIRELDAEAVELKSLELNVLRRIELYQEGNVRVYDRLRPQESSLNPHCRARISNIQQAR